MLSDLGQFLLALYQQWIAMLTGSILAVLILWAEHYYRRSVSWRRFAAILGIALLWACFAAWREEHAELGRLRERERAAADKARGDLAELQGELKAARTAIAEKDGRLADMQLIINKMPDPPPIVNVQPAPPAPRPAEHAWLVVERLRPDFSKKPFMVTVTVRNIGRIPATEARLKAVIATTPKRPDYSNSGVLVARKVFGPGLAYRLEADFDITPERCKALELGETPFFLHTHLEYSDGEHGERKPSEACSYWDAAVKKFYDCP